MKNHNYISVSGWMLNDLKLKGNKVLIYALIYGFSQDGEGDFSGRISYISDTFSLTKKAVISIINDLVSDGYIIKSQYLKNGVCCNVYQVDFLKISKKNKKLPENISDACLDFDKHGAYSFLKAENPIFIESWEMKYKKRFKDFEKFVKHFDYKFDEEDLAYKTKVIKARLNRFADNWLASESKYAVEEKIEKQAYQDVAI